MTQGSQDSTANSEHWLGRARAVMPGGVSSPVRSFRAVPTKPTVLTRGAGARVVDVDGRTFIDVQMAFGPLILGHSHPAVVEAITRAARDSQGFGATTPAEVELAELILSRLPGCDRVRFVCSGTEAVMSAMRLARAATGRPTIVKFEGGYHGHCDSLLVKAGSGLATFGTPSSAGVTEALARDTRVLPFADLGKAEELFAHEGKSIAAVVIEPVPANNGLLIQDLGYLRALRALCRKHGALFLADEVITGFRLSAGSHALELGLEPDLITLGKIIGGGMPVGAYAGRYELMKLIAPDGPVYQAGTLAGHPVAMAAGLAQLRTLLEEQPYAQLAARAQRLVREANQSARGRATFLSIGSILWGWFGKAPPPHAAHEIDEPSVRAFAPFHESLFAERVWWPPSAYEVAFLSTAHDDTVIATLSAAIAKAL